MATWFGLFGRSISRDQCANTTPRYSNTTEVKKAYNQLMDEDRRKLCIQLIKQARKIAKRTRKKALAKVSFTIRYCAACVVLTRVRAPRHRRWQTKYSDSRACYLHRSSTERKTMRSACTRNRGERLSRKSTRWTTCEKTTRMNRNGAQGARSAWVPGSTLLAANGKRFVVFVRIFVCTPLTRAQVGVRKSEAATFGVGGATDNQEYKRKWR